MAQAKATTGATGGRKLSSRARRRRWSRTIVDRHAVGELSRDERWRRRGGSGRRERLIAAIATALALCGAAATFAWFHFTAAPEAGPRLPTSPLAIAANRLFPEALPFRTTERELPGGGREVTVLLPAYLLESSAASIDPFERLSAPYKGGQRRLTGPEVAARIEALRDTTPEAAELHCTSHVIGTDRTLERNSGLPVRTRPVRIALLPAC